MKLNKEKIRIREITSSDLPFLAKLNGQIFDDADTGHIFNVLKFSFKNRIDEATFLVERIDDKESEFIGAIFIENDITFAAKKAAWIRSIFIEPKWQKKGIGNKLLKKALSKLASKKYSVFLSVKDSNREAIKLYKNMGFVKEKTIMKRS